jgi:PAS domain S-box-containing protein
MTRLHIIGGPEKGLSFELNVGSTSVGRGPENDIQVDDPSVSRNHLRISCTQGRYMVEDLESYNGTLVEGKPIPAGRAHEVAEGHIICIGDTSLVLGGPCEHESPTAGYAISLTGPEAEEEGDGYKTTRVASRRQLETICELSTLMMESLDLQALCEKLMDGLFVWFKRIDSGVILLMDEDSGGPRPLVARSRNSRRRAEVNYSHTIVDRVIREGKALLTPNYDDQEGNGLSESMKLMRVTSTMCVPLVSKGRPLGVIYVHSRELGASFEREDLLFLTALSGPAAMAIENGMLFSSQMKTATALRQSEELYRVTFQAIPDAITLTRLKDDRFIEVNEGFCAMTGFSREEALGRTPVDLNLFVNPSERTKFIEILKRDGQVNGYELKCRRSDSVLFDGLLSCRPLRYGNDDCLVTVAKDITTVKESQTEKARLETQLRQAQKLEAIGTLAGGISHDFNNILAAMMGYTELVLLNQPEGSRVHHYLDEILKAGERAKNLVSQILAFSRQGESERKPIQLRPIVKESLKLLRASLPATIEIRQDIATDEAIVLADPAQIHQIIMNLCTNAAHAMRENGGILEVGLHQVQADKDLCAAHPDLRPGPCVAISVGDTGCGMTAEVLDRIFEPYFTTKEKGEGTGLGLAVLHGIVTGYGGVVSVKSEPARGSVFKIYLPAVETATPQPRSDEKLESGRERILFVDDEPSLVEIGREMLQHLGYEVVTFSSSLDALSAFRVRPDLFDLVITDMTMPQMTGERLAQALIEIRPDLPVILCTGYSERITEERASALGIKGFLLKPLSAHDLAKKVRDTLDQKPS